MQKQTNIYKACRREAGLTQERAGEMLNIATGTLSRYENGRIPVTQDMAAAMIRAYRTPTLARRHMEYANPELMPYVHMTERPPTDGRAAPRWKAAEKERGNQNGRQT